ncbi:MAG: PhoH family protein, partial [Bacilli bacterium]|nr:PhoH family protein [Bacilli bacterium]
LVLRRIKCIFEAMELLLENKIILNDIDFYSLISNIDSDNYKSIVSLYLDKEVLFNTVSGKAVYPKTLNQKMYVKALETNDIVFALGPAGTGKTYLGVMFALKYLKTFKARRIVLVRPIVEAGEKLGFLPGDLKEKIDPYLLPIYDALYEAIGKETVTKMIEKGTIEVAPLAYMRGRTLDNAVVILDEAQNATLTQMKMFLTRLGFNSKMIVTGDITQIDLPNPHYSGLIEATSLLDDVKGIKIIKFERGDVMRHPLVFKIIERYENR